MSSDKNSTLHNMKESVKDAAETVGDKLQSAGEAIKDKAVSAKDKVSGAFTGHSSDKHTHEFDREFADRGTTPAEHILYDKRQELQSQFQAQADEGARRAADAMHRKAEHDNAAVRCTKDCALEKAREAHNEVTAEQERLRQKKCHADAAACDAQRAVHAQAQNAMQNTKETAAEYSDAVRRNAADAYVAATNAADNAAERMQGKAEADYIRNVENVNCATANMRQNNDAGAQVHRIALP